jgi:ubiquinone/menaquinone biosynthesis C-methylase UbiE
MAEQITPERIGQLAWGYAPSLILEAAIRHRVFDLLDAGPKSIQQLKTETGCSERGLRAILNALVALKFLSKDSSQQYSLAPESSAFLVSTKPSYQGGIFKHITGHLIPSWMKLTEVVKTGQGVREVDDEDKGAKFFEEFVEDIFPMSFGAAKTLAEHLKISAASQPVKVLDLAAGSGVWGIALAKASQQVRVTAVDWEGVLPVTKRVTQKHGVADQFSYLAGNINEVAFGTGFNIATLGHILHSEGAEHSRKLICKTFEALAPGGTIAIGEFLANEDRTGPVNAMIFAVNMLVNTSDGDTFSFAEISSWLTEAGFKNPRTLDAPGPSPMILATKP